MYCHVFFGSQCIYIYISPGSVETFVRCGGIFNNNFVANLQTSLPVNFENQLTFGKVTGKSMKSCFFSGSQCISFINTRMSACIYRYYVCMWCGSIFNDHTITNLMLKLLVKIT